MKTCATCKFYNNGECRRYPPAVIGCWPEVGKEDWCGEHREKELAQPGKAEQLQPKDSHE